MTAYALRFDGNFYAELAAQVQLTGAGSLGWRVEFDIEPDNIAGSAHGFMSGILNNGRTRFFKSSNDGFTLSARGLVSGSVLGDSGSFAAGQSWPNSLLTVIAYSRESGGTGATVNGSGGTNATTGRNFDLFRIGDGATTNLFRGLMYEVRVYQNDVLIHRFKNTVGTGNVWTDQVGGNNATLGGTVPSDNSQWVPYDDGAGSTEQITSSGGIASALAGGAASAQIINEQVLSASGIAAAVASGIASATIVNEQVNSSGGIASAIASGSSSTSVINEQVVSSSGIAAAIAGATASTQVINEQTSEQIVSSGGIAASTGSASASTQIISEQVVSSGGVAGAVAGGTASSEQVNEQIIISGGQANAYASGFASTQIVNEQNSEQIITTGGASSALASATASTQFISEHIISSGGIAQAFASGVLSSLVINRTSEPLAPERMSATRLLPAITAQHIVPAITGSRLINNISAQRV